MNRVARSCASLAAAAVVASLLMTFEAEDGGTPVLAWMALVNGLVGYLFAVLAAGAWAWSHRA